MDARRLYPGEGCSSLFTYCTRVLRLSEHAAYARIEAARAVRRFPIVLERLIAGEITLTAIGLLRPHLSDANCGELLDSARHASKREIERLIASIAPRPDAPVVIRRCRCAFEGRETGRTINVDRGADQHRACDWSDTTVSNRSSTGA